MIIQELLEDTAKMEITERDENPITSSKALSNEKNKVEAKNDQLHNLPEVSEQGKHLKQKTDQYCYNNIFERKVFLLDETLNFITSSAKKLLLSDPKITSLHHLEPK